MQLCLNPNAKSIEAGLCWFITSWVSLRSDAFLFLSFSLLPLLLGRCFTFVVLAVGNTALATWNCCNSRMKGIREPQRQQEDNQEAGLPARMCRIIDPDVRHLGTDPGGGGGERLTSEFCGCVPGLLFHEIGTSR